MPSICSPTQEQVVVLVEDMKVSFTNNDRTNEFVITINRPEGSQVNGNLDTKLGHSDTDLGINSDTFMLTLTLNIDTLTLA